ncbi:uncharacterized protein LOC133539000 [Nerophis ophidion]|uniref:uncharacterized protein LOC133539000 n=1 Tax=Nerophis ophidion TaxID=159077 RepID=UPI002AE02FF2|nr:uncharacterized protein LOC133539000 [Nerophis ophidion]
MYTQTSTFILSVATSRLDKNIPEEEPEWPEAGSIFNSTCKSSVMSILKGYTVQESTKSSVGRQEAAAEAAASQAVLKVLQEQEREQLELNILEEKARKKIAEQEAAARKRRLQQEEDEVRRRIQREEEEAEIKAQLEEHIALQRTLEEKRRKIKKLETVKSLNAAKARMLIYDQRSVKEERSDKLGDDFKEDDQVSAPSSHLSTHRSSVSKVKKTSNDSTAELVKMLAGALSVNRIPIPEPATFSGDPLKYSDWKLSFQILIDQKNILENKKIYYLRRYIGGQAKKALDGYFLLGTESAYTAAWEILEERYGNPFTIAKAYRDKIQAWPKIGSKDSLELREFTDFLRSCEAAMVNIKALEILNDCNENRKILSKLPDWLIAAWNRKVMEMEQEKKQFPSFSHFVRFLTWEAKVACNPITSVQSLKSSDTDKPRSQRLQSFGAKTLNTSSNEKTLTSFNEKTTTSKEKNVMTCIFCERNNHTLHKCRKFMEKAVTDRVKFIQAERLCFGCLQSGHRSKNCSNRSVCDTCEKKHPTCLHEERTKDEQKPPQAKPSTSQENPNEILPQAPQNKERTKEATSCRVILQKDNIQTAAIIPVWLSSTTQPTQEVLVYALLDSQSDTTFFLSEVADALEVDKEQVKLKLFTMTSRITVVSSQKVTNLQVRGFYSGEKIALPPVYTREFIPANRTHIPTGETAKAWSHLKYLQDEIPPPQDCGVGLLIGYNCSQALLPREVVSGKENQPYAQRTDLGWSIIGNQKVHHQGRGMTMNEMRANGWWVLGCSSAVSSHIFKCVRCRKYRRSTEEQRMGDLPEDRTETTPPFTYTGIDCFGPIYVKDGRKDMKRYGLLLTCLCSRAIHIEVVDDMTTDAFINALRTFIAIRGNVRQLRCDQGTNFVGAKREFAELMTGMDQERVKALRCEFLMNPPAASHMGGIWERQIRTIISVLMAVLDQSARRLDSTLLRTVLYEVMAIINSRPLTAEHLNDPSGPEPLTPNHILTMKSTIILPPPGEFVREDLYLKKRWRGVQYLANEFWTRWKREYLLNLQSRQKWHKNRRNLKVNDIVLLKDDLAPRNEWKLARITDVYPGSDGRVRKLKLMVSETTFDKKGKLTTKTGFLDRPVQKVVILLEAE